MFNAKKEVNKTLSSLDCIVTQKNPGTFNKLPVVTFDLANNNANYDLDNLIGYQDIEMRVDIWAESSPQASRLLEEVEQKMRTIFYQLSFSADIPNTDDNLYHISSRFKKIA